MDTPHTHRHCSRDSSRRKRTGSRSQVRRHPPRSSCQMDTPHTHRHCSRDSSRRKRTWSRPRMGCHPPRSSSQMDTPHTHRHCSRVRPRSTRRQSRTASRSQVRRHPHRSSCQTDTPRTHRHCSRDSSRRKRTGLRVTARVTVTRRQYRVPSTTRVALRLARREPDGVTPSDTQPDHCSARFVSAEHEAAGTHMPFDQAVPSGHEHCVSPSASQLSSPSGRVESVGHAEQTY